MQPPDHQLVCSSRQTGSFTQANKSIVACLRRRFHRFKAHPIVAHLKGVPARTSGDADPHLLCLSMAYHVVQPLGNHAQGRLTKVRRNVRDSFQIGLARNPCGLNEMANFLLHRPGNDDVFSVQGC